MTLSEEQL